MATWPAALLAILAALIAVPAAAQEADGAIVEHNQGLPNFLTHFTDREAVLTADVGLEVELGGSAREALATHQRLEAALSELAPQRPGTVDAYVISIALDSDPVFAREAREAGAVLGHRYGADARTIVLAGPDGESDDLPHGSLTTLSIALARIAEVMDVREDALVLFVTAHGQQTGLFYHYGDQGFGGMSPARLAELLDELGIGNRLLVINSCFSGSFVPGLASATSVIVTAASADRTSFGCQPSSDWTYFGDAFVNRALRRPQPIRNAFGEAQRLVSKWEFNQQLTPSEPRLSIGERAASWLGPLEQRMPQDTTPRQGEPAVTD